MKNFGEILLILVTSLAPLNALCGESSHAASDPSGNDIVNPTFVKDARAVCLAGNPAAYYYSKGFGKGVSNWIVYLQGGGWCMNITDCNGYIQRRGVGVNATAAALHGNLLSSNKKKNPDFFNWNRIDVRYCDASSFTGNSEINQNDTKLYFRGAIIFKAIMQELLESGMGNAKNALLAGSSAGGVATTIYCDRFRRYFSNTSRVKCFSDGGYFFLSKKHMSQRNTFLSMFDGLIKLHGSKNALPTSCTSRLSPEMCFFPQNLQADIQTPIFFLMSAFDQIQIEYTMVTKEFDTCANGRNCSLNQIKIMQDIRSELLSVLPKQSHNSKKGILITSPYAHTQVLGPSWYFRAAKTGKRMVFRQQGC
ncbi:PREDICTED: pectin acetylesterase 8-like isoform X2 [Ipomoea nil]|uniref:pectin acetylesterase 8-like isoform X2 n=1 Tax=Ipomoea nil TaxID=35883 RepID=UPI0009008FCB|nr:PREDICTED: pectin acetylesterase 8-like isoform X2 [Ipomoea nil]